MTCQRTLQAYLLLFFLSLVIALQFTSLANSVNDQESELLETGKATKIQNAAASPAAIKIVSYNIRWRGGEDLRKLIELFKTDKEIGGASILGLQEVDRNKKRTMNQNTARALAEELGMHYAWAAPPPPAKDNAPQEEETGVCILSAYPLTDVERILLPNEGPQGRRRVAIGATVQIGQRSVRVYSVHAEIRASNRERLQQLQAVIDDLDKRHEQVARAVVLGDFNTWTGKDVDSTAKLFTGAKFSTPFVNGLTTWKTFIIELKLDWLWLRGLQPVNYGIDRKIRLSDHWPLWVEVKL